MLQDIWQALCIWCWPHYVWYCVNSRFAWTVVASHLLCFYGRQTLAGVIKNTLFWCEFSRLGVNMKVIISWNVSVTARKFDLYFGKGNSRVNLYKTARRNNFNPFFNASEFTMSWKTCITELTIKPVKIYISELSSGRLLSLGRTVIFISHQE